MPGSEAREGGREPRRLLEGCLEKLRDGDVDAPRRAPLGPPRCTTAKMVGGRAPTTARLAASRKGADAPAESASVKDAVVCVLRSVMEVVEDVEVLVKWIVCCTCGQWLIDSESRGKINKLRLGALSIPNYVIKKGPTHGARHGKTEEQKEHHLAWNAWKRCCKTVDSQGEHFAGIHDRFLRDPVYRESQLESDGQNKSAKSWTNLQKKTIHTNSLQRREEDAKDIGILL